MKRDIPVFPVLLAALTLCIALLSSYISPAVLAAPHTYEATPEPPAPPDPPPPTPTLEPGGFIQVEGSNLTRLGRPVQIKGINYYPRERPWAEMWESWDAPQMERELRLARDQLGINAARVLLPYEFDRKQAINRLHQLVQIAGNLDMRLIVALFDFKDHFPHPGSPEEEKHFKYLRDLIGNFAGDERIFAWDLHNEPEHYLTWQQGGAPRVLQWLSRMADEVHRIAPHHLVTVGMGQYDNLWQPGPDGRRVIDYSDVISFHNYNTEDTARQLRELRSHTSKPILLQEFGWPTGPRCVVRAYTEETQDWVYRTVLQAVEGQVAGIFAWTLRDYHAGPTVRWDTREEYYGLYRPDDTLKPAAESFRAYPAVPLPSVTRTNFPLTRENMSPPGGPLAPEVIPESGYYVKGWFRVAWEQLGGRGTFGLPLGEAYALPGDPREHVVQYFEAAVLEYDPARDNGPGFAELSMDARAMRAIQPMDIGVAHTAGRTFPQSGQRPRGARRFPETGYSIQGDFRRFYEGSRGEWRLGAPISEELVEEIYGVPTRVQYFQRGSLEVDPATGIIRLGLLGAWSFDMQCRTVQ